MPCSKPNRKSAILIFVWILRIFLAISRLCTLTNSSYRLNPINFRFGQYNLKTFVMKSYSNGEFSLNDLTVAWRPFWAIRHETGSCCNKSVHNPICPKFLRHDEGPVLKTYTCPYWLMATPQYVSHAPFHNSWTVCRRISWVVSYHSAESSCFIGEGSPSPLHISPAPLTN